MRNVFAVSLSFVVTVLVVVILDGDRHARADIPPPDSCTAPGQPCNNAGPSFNQAGTCAPSTCTRTVPGPDGGTMSMSYACNLCKIGGDGGDGGDGGAGGGAGGATGTGGSTGNDAAANPDGGTASSSKGCGCALGDPAPGDWLGGTLVVVGLLGFLHARRRRRP